MSQLIDACGRSIDYLRLSVTDRCDLRCSYCMPAGFNDYHARDACLDVDELVRVVRIFARLGVRRVRLTGGEPLVRGRILELAQRIRAQPGIEDLSLSTNGTRLAGLAVALHAAGVRRLNVSLDTLMRERFAKLTGRDALDDVLAGLQAARAAGFALIKLNMVWLPGVNGDELDAMITFCLNNGFILRLIETMPVGCTGRETGTHPLTELIATLKARHGLVDAVIPGGGPARYYATPDGRFSIGFITPMSRHFCDTCNRLRVAADGRLFLCLGDEHNLDLRARLRAGESDEAVAAAIRGALRTRPRGHQFNERPEKVLRFMSGTGG